MELRIIKNPEKAPNLGTRFGQHVEPKGTYVLASNKHIPGWLVGKASLQNPLIIDIDDDTLIKYKIDLATKYKAVGTKLTQKLMKIGYDAIITRYPDNTYGEIVLFPNSNFILDSSG